MILSLTLALTLTDPNPDPDEVHFQTKFCSNCRSTIFLVPLARLRAVGAEQVQA
jgi:hypothetical protein